MADTEESPAQRQARLRREKREKKILAGGTSRLDKITSVSGRPAESSAAAPATDLPHLSPSTSFDIETPSKKPPTNSDPLFGLSTSSTSRSNEPSQAELEESMRQLLRGPAPGARPLDEDQKEPQDPMLAMLQQMMGASLPAQADGTPAPGFDGLPPGLAAMLGNGFGAAGPGGAGNMPGSAVPSPPAKQVYTWKMVHELFSLCLGIWVLYVYSFSGTEAARIRGAGFASVSGMAVNGGIFWVFVTAELILQSTRYLLEGGRVEEGMLKSIAGFLPPPWNQRLLLGGRYLSIWTTIVQDVFVVIFLLGVAAWWKS